MKNLSNYVNPEIKIIFLENEGTMCVSTLDNNGEIGDATEIDYGIYEF